MSLVVLVAATIIGAWQWGLEGVTIGVVLHKLVQMSWSTWLVRRVLRTHSSAPAQQLELGVEPVNRLESER
jgi:hypothetical protein